MFSKLLTPIIFTIILFGAAGAEPTPTEINGYFNPGPDAHTDLDAFIFFNHISDMPDGANLATIDLDYDYLIQDIDTQLKPTLLEARHDINLCIPKDTNASVCVV